MIYTDYNIIKSLLLKKTPYKFKTNKLFILPWLKNKKMEIYNGQNYAQITLKINMVSYYIFNFIYSKKIPRHKDKNLKINKGKFK